MKDFFNKLIASRSGVSSMRVMSLVALLAAIAVAFYGLHQGSELSGLSMLCGTFLASAFGGKVAQKSIENKGASNEDQDKSKG